MIRSPRRPAAVVFTVLTVLAVSGTLAGCGSDQPSAAPPPSPVTTTTSAPSSTGTTPSSTGATTSASTSTSAAAHCPYPDSGFDCDFQHRFAVAQQYLATRPGTVGIVVRDRNTGAVWRNDHASDHVWTASTIKLGMTVDLLLRDRDGRISLTSGDRDLIARMLNSSDDNAADSLWFKYSGADHLTFNRDFPRYGLTTVQPQRGFSKYYPYWGFQKCTPEDLDRLINYVLNSLPDELRDYVVPKMRTVAANQQWGVWGAGPSARPGNKDGWSLEQGGWVMNTVGFAGPDERYTLAVMNSLRGEGGYDDGRATDTHVAELIFRGRF